MRVVRSPCGNFLSEEDDVPVKGKAVWNQAFCGRFLNPLQWAIQPPGSLKIQHLDCGMCHFRNQEGEEESSRPSQEEGSLCLLVLEIWVGLRFFPSSFFDIHRGEVTLPTSCRGVLHSVERRRDLKSGSERDLESDGFDDQSEVHWGLGTGRCLVDCVCLFSQRFLNFRGGIVLWWNCFFMGSC